MRFELTEWLKELGLQLLCTRHAALSLSLSPPPSLCPQHFPRLLTSATRGPTSAFCWL